MGKVKRPIHVVSFHGGPMDGEHLLVPDDQSKVVFPSHVREPVVYIDPGTRSSGAMDLLVHVYIRDLEAPELFVYEGIM